MWFDWDGAKAAANQKKHGIAFEIAVTIFDDPFHLSVVDIGSHSEERWVTIGRAIDLFTLVVVHTEVHVVKGKEIVRLISARRATKKEMKQYEEGI